MSLIRRVAILSLALLLTAAANAQQPQAGREPHAGFVYPAGGRQGTTLRVTLGGQFLDGVSAACVCGPGVKATLIEYVKPPTPKQIMELRDELKQLMDKRQAAGEGPPAGGGGAGAAAAPATRPAPGPTTRPAWTAADRQRLMELRTKLAAALPRPANPAIAESVTLEITIAPDAAPGRRELRLRTALGLTNPLVFCVGQLPEIALDPAPVGRGDSKTSVPPHTTTVAIPLIVNGQILPGGVDRYEFSAKAGQKLVCACDARALVPYLADAVPGWFQASLTLYDPAGHTLASSSGFRFNPDPVLYYQVPRDGTYALEIHDAIYRGRQDFVYRIAVGEIPFLAGVFPLGAPAGGKATLALAGWNLPASSLEVDGAAAGGTTRQVGVRQAGLLSNTKRFAVDALPECTEVKPNDQQAVAQMVTLPVIVNGRIAQEGQRALFRFEGRSGDKVVAEVYARRLDSPLDSLLELTDASGKRLALNDDCEDKAAGLLTHQADSYLTAALPADGTYYLCLSDAEHAGGPEYAYRLRLSAPMPDFALRIAPSAINARAGAQVAVTVYAIRRDNFAGPIALSLRGGPAGFSLSGKVPAGQDQAQVTLTVPRTALDEPVSLDVEGAASIQGRPVVRRAVPADDMMQAFAYHHLVPAQELLVMVLGRPPIRAATQAAGAAPVKSGAAPGGKNVP
jgi:hypothetical protein